MKNYLKIIHRVKIAIVIFFFLFSNVVFGQSKLHADTFYIFASFSKKSQIIVTSDSIIRNGVNFTSDTIYNCIVYKILKTYNKRNYKYFNTSSYHGEGYEIVSFQKAGNKLTKVAFTEVLGWVSPNFYKKRNQLKKYSDPDILPYSQLFNKIEIIEMERYVSFKSAATVQILNALDTLIKLKLNWRTLENRKPELGKLGVHFYTEIIAQALIKNKINPFYNNNFFEALKERPDYDKLT